MKRNLGWLRPLAITTAFVFIVGACGSTAAPSASTAASAAAPSTGASSAAPSASTAAVNACGDAPVALSIWGGYPELDAVFKKAGESYKTTHPNVDLTIFSTDLRGFEQKLTTALPVEAPRATSSSGPRTSCPGSSTRTCCCRSRRTS